MKIIQITDTHLGAPDEMISCLSPIVRLQTCVADIESNHSDADFCVFSGDLTDAGKPEAYQAFREIINALTPPAILMMGNHDNRQNLSAAFPELEKDNNGFVQSTQRNDEGDFIFLDTVDQGSHLGLYCEKRRHWLTDQLEKAQGRPVFLFMHHPPFDVGLPSLDALGLQDKEAFAEVLYRHDNIRHLFFGHVHRPISGSWQGIPFSALRGTNHGVAFDFTAPGYVPKSYEPPAYAVIFIEDGNVLVHLHDFLDETKMVLDDKGRWIFERTGEYVVAGC
ncbi:MAG: phosphodiesterase [Rhodospirillaceae bacterium]|jgi:3',5'-cyclic-AMP phosphodiesterase|nr:phosphodiesterase [Rhodospirillaceae bacterium]MBT5245242.1 phosphodiesterase [Rhodospirillaceae bacterium]MBT5562773.1 phosphodiesterase [Rhodospirillaceae bacterium]MBT6240702.1 phosphodiesterase [Rhodospirillaceae bacterium]